MEEFLKTFFTSVIGGVFGGVVVFFSRKQIAFFFDEKIRRNQNQREALSKLLTLWHNRRADDSSEKEWTIKYADIIRDVMLWCPDDVLLHLSKYFELDSTKNTAIAREQFGMAILCFRKTIGFKNSKEVLTANNIVEIFNSGYPGAV